MKKRNQRILLNVLAFSILAIAVYYVFFENEQSFPPSQTLNAVTR